MSDTATLSATPAAKARLADYLELTKPRLSLLSVLTTVVGWFAARPSGTENIYKIYAESFLSEDHLQLLLTDAQAVVDGALGEA